jgi:hypothetical protein
VELIPEDALDDDPAGSLYSSPLMASSTLPLNYKGFDMLNIAPVQSASGHQQHLTEEEEMDGEESP